MASGGPSGVYIHTTLNTRAAPVTEDRLIYLMTPKRTKLV